MSFSFTFFLNVYLTCNMLYPVSIQSALASSEPMLRCAAGEAMGRMSQVGGDSSFVARIAQTSFDQLKTTRDAIIRTGHSLVLGCLHRYVGGMGSGQHLQMSVSILHGLARDTSSPTVQVTTALITTMTTTTTTTTTTHLWHMEPQL